MKKLLQITSFSLVFWLLLLMPIKAQTAQRVIVSQTLVAKMNTQLTSQNFRERFSELERYNFLEGTIALMNVDEIYESLDLHPLAKQAIRRVEKLRRIKDGGSDGADAHQIRLETIVGEVVIQFRADLPSEPGRLIVAILDEEFQEVFSMEILRFMFIWLKRTGIERLAFNMYDTKAIVFFKEIISRLNLEIDFNSIKVGSSFSIFFNELPEEQINKLVTDADLDRMDQFIQKKLRSMQELHERSVAVSA